MLLFFLAVCCGSATAPPLVVAQDGTGKHAAIQAAVDGVQFPPLERIYIFIRYGVCRKQSVLSSRKMSFIHDNDADSLGQSHCMTKQIAACSGAVASSATKLQHLYTTPGGHIRPNGWHNLEKPEAEKTKPFAESELSPNRYS